MKALISKLGVKPDSRVTVVGLKDAGFRKQLRARTSDVWESKVERESDFIFLAANHKEDLDMLTLFRYYLRKNGAIWVVYRKGMRDIKKSDVMASGKKAGLVDTKVVSFSDTHSALKFVIPARRR
jgi:hypothetical protein